MSKTILADVSGFTPVIDRMAMEHGLVYAAVFGRMWRFCQMEDGVCKASLDKIARGLHVDKATVMRYADRLVADGYLKDLTPDLRNAPHVYADTGKALIKVGIGVTVAGCNADTEQGETVAGCNATVEQGNATVAGCNATVAQSKLKIVSKIDHKKDAKDGMSHPDFDRACAYLNENLSSDYFQAAPILIEVNEKPNRMLVKLATFPAGFIDAFKTALAQASRRSWSVSFETPGTGMAAQVESPGETPIESETIDPGILVRWEDMKYEISQDVNPLTYRDMIDPAILISANGQWKIAVPNVMWWQTHIEHGLGRMYHRITGEAMTFVFVELSK